MSTRYGTDPHRVMILDAAYMDRIGPLLTYNHSRDLEAIVRSHFEAQRLRTLRPLFQAHGSAEAAKRAHVPRTVLTQELRSKTNPVEALPLWVEVDYARMATSPHDVRAYVRDLRQTQTACGQIIAQVRGRALRKAVGQLGADRVAALTGMHPATVAERVEMAMCEARPHPLPSGAPERISMEARA